MSQRARSSSLAALLLGNEADGLAIDFTDLSMVIRDTTTPANNFVGDPNAKLTYASPSTKWVRNRAGVLVSGTALRTEYDLSGNALGVRLEEQRTNLFLNSRVPATQNVTVSAVAYTLSFFGTGSITRSGTSSGTLSGTGADDRVSVTFTPTAGTLTLTVSGTIDFVQLEAGPSATSPIVTSGASVTRVIDALSIAQSLFPASVPGTIVLGYRLLALVTTTAQTAAVLYSSGSNVVSMLANNTAGSFGATITTSGAGQGFNDIVGVSANANVKQAFAFATNSSAHVAKGGSPVTDSTVNLPVVDTLRLGINLFGANSLNGHIRQALVLPRRMSNAELQAITT